MLAQRPIILFCTNQLLNLQGPLFHCSKAVGVFLAISTKQTPPLDWIIVIISSEQQMAVSPHLTFPLQDKSAVTQTRDPPEPLTDNYVVLVVYKSSSVKRLQKFDFYWTWK